LPEGIDASFLNIDEGSACFKRSLHRPFPHDMCEYR